MNFTLFKYFITFLIVSTVFFTGVQSCGLIKSPEAGVHKNRGYEPEKTVLTDNKQEVSRPNYVPPDSGGSNQKWSCNRHRELMKERNCYFGKGIRRCESGRDTSNSN